MIAVVVVVDNDGGNVRKTMENLGTVLIVRSWCGAERKEKVFADHGGDGGGVGSWRIAGNVWMTFTPSYVSTNDLDGHNPFCDAVWC